MSRATIAQLAERRNHLPTYPVEVLFAEHIELHPVRQATKLNAPSAYGRTIQQVRCWLRTPFKF